RELSPTRGQQRQVENERQKRDDQPPAAEAKQRAEEPGGRATGDQPQADEHRDAPYRAGGGTSAGVSALWTQVLRRVRQQGDDDGAPARERQLALVGGARAGLAARLDLRPLRQVAPEAVHFLVVDLDRLFCARPRTRP